MQKDGDEMFALMKEKLCTPVVGDILGVMDCPHRFLPVAIQPLRDSTKMAGKVCTILECNVYQAQKRPFGLLTEVLDQLKKNKVYIATGAHNSVMWGEILTVTARMCGAAGAVFDGYTGDTSQVLEQGSPVLAIGRWAQGSSIRANIIDFRCTIEIGGVIIYDGDLIFGDMGGVLIIPKEAAIQCTENTLKRAAGEKQMRKAIENGMSITETFRKFGIL